MSKTQAVIKNQHGTTKIYETLSDAPGERVIVVPGYSEGIRHTRKLLGALAARGLDAVSFSQPRRRGDKSVDPIDRQTQVLKDVISAETAEDEKVHAVGHSLGAAAILRAAQDEPDKFASITLFQPAGAVGRQRFRELLRRVGNKTVRNHLVGARSQDASKHTRHSHYTASADTESAVQHTGRVTAAQTAGLGTILRQPKLGIQEAVAAGNYYLGKDLERVSQLGIPVHVVTSHSDEMFDPAKSQRGFGYVVGVTKLDGPEPNVANAGLPNIAIAEVADPYAGHDTFWMQPERTANIINETIHASRP